MIVITGGTGHVGGAAADYLLARQEKVTIVTRHPEKAGVRFNHRAAEAQLAIDDIAGLHHLFTSAHSAFILNPPAATNTDTDVEERRTARALTEALKDTPITKLVVESTASAQKGDHIGDLGVLFELEEAVKSLGKQTTILRPTYYMTNWLSSLQQEEDQYKLVSFYPEDLAISMVAPDDIGGFAGQFLLDKNSPPLVEIEGPSRYTPKEVAETFARVLGKRVELEVIPPEKWKTAYQSIGFSEAAAISYSNMNRIAMENKFELRENAWKGKTSLEQFLADHFGAEIKS